MIYHYYEYPKCSTCRLAKKELVQLGVTFEAIDIKQTPPPADVIKSWLASGVPLKSLFNTSGNSYRQLGLKDKLQTLTEDDAIALLAADGMLIKRPLLVLGNQLLQVGYRTPYNDLRL